MTENTGRVEAADNLKAQLDTLNQEVAKTQNKIFDYVLQYRDQVAPELLEKEDAQISIKNRDLETLFEYFNKANEFSLAASTLTRAMESLYGTANTLSLKQEEGDDADGTTE